MRLFDVALLYCTAAFAQLPAFEVASIKPTAAIDKHTTFHSTPGRLAMTGYTLRALIVEAYNVGGFQVLGGPGWMDDDRYDILARADGPAKWPGSQSGGSVSVVHHLSPEHSRLKYKRGVLQLRTVRGER